LGSAKADALSIVENKRPPAFQSIERVNELFWDPGRGAIFPKTRVERGRLVRGPVPRWKIGPKSERERVPPVSTFFLPGGPAQIISRP